MNEAVKTPRHIAIIMDGNRRWAKKRFLPVSYGHKKGTEAFVSIAEACGELGVEYLTVYAFSTENWSRSKEEVEALSGIIRNTVSEQLLALSEKNVCINVLGEIHRFDADTQKAIEKAVSVSREKTGLTVNICLSYGGRADITKAVNDLIAAGKTVVTEQDIAAALYTGDMPEPELMIRTGGEVRVSNFLLWQCAYSEMYFTDVLWPDFDKDQLVKAIKWYSGRSRRFGGTEGDIKK